jgi:hypothetical protein
MTLASRSTSRFVFAGLLAVLLPSAGCGGATYELGNVGDGGKKSGASSTSGFCFSDDDGGCEGGDSFSSGTGGSSDTGSNSNGYSFPDAGGPNMATPDASGSSNSSPSSSGSTNGVCTVSSIGCPAGTTGYACDGASPAAGSEGTISCSDGAFTSSGTDYCCFPWPAGSKCAPYPGFPCDDNSFGYQCSPAASPSQIVSQLSCGTPFPDSNGQNDFCCVYQ